MASVLVLLFLVTSVAMVACDNDIFGDDLVYQDMEETLRHLASSVEDMGDLFCREQLLLQALATFHSSASNGIDFSRRLQKTFYPSVTVEDKAMSKLLRISGSLEKHRVMEFPTTEQCVRHAGNPLQAFLLLWRATKVTYTPPSQEPTVH